MSDSSSEGRERREAVRIAKPLEIVYSSDSPPISARIEDLSEKGAFVGTDNPLAPGSELDFRFDLPDSQAGEVISGRARVQWIEPMVGMGIEFESLSQAQQDRLRFFVASVFFGQPADLA